jgi:hypothetical protein
MLNALTNKSVDAIVQVQPFAYLVESTGKALWQVIAVSIR